MENFLKRISALLVVISIVVACTKDGPAPQLKNSMTYNNTEFDFNRGMLEFFGNIQGSGMNIDLVLLTPGLTPVVTNGRIDSITGIGSGINFEIFTSGSNSLTVGDYTFDATMSGSPGTFDFGNAIFDFNTLTQDGTTLDIKAGKITVISNSPVYEISFNCTAENGKNIKGYYKGSLQYYDMSVPTKSGRLLKRHKW